MPERSNIVPLGTMSPQYWPQNEGQTGGSSWACADDTATQEMMAEVLASAFAFKVWHLRGTKTNCLIAMIAQTVVLGVRLVFHH